MNARGSVKVAIRAEILKGMRPAEICARLGTTMDYVRQIRSVMTGEGAIPRLSNGRPQISAEAKAKIIELARIGRSYNEISRIVGVSRNTVAGIVARGREGQSPVCRRGSRGDNLLRAKVKSAIPLSPSVIFPPVGATGQGFPLEAVQETSGCRWPVSHDRPHLFCGAVRHSPLPFVADGQPYCSDHRKQGYQKPSGGLRAAERAHAERSWR